MFELSKEEYQNLRSHFGTSSWGGTRYLPFAFTEQGVAMLSSVLNSERAIQVNIAIMRTFTKLRQMIETHKELKQKIEEMEKKYDKQFQIVFAALKELLEEPKVPETKKLPIGFHHVKKERLWPRFVKKEMFILLIIASMSDGWHRWWHSTAMASWASRW